MKDKDTLSGTLGSWGSSFPATGLEDHDQGPHSLGVNVVEGAGLLLPGKNARACMHIQDQLSTTCFPGHTARWDLARSGDP